MTGHERSALSNERNPRTSSGEPVIYQIRIKGHLDRRWADWFEGMTITPEEGGETLLTGSVVDQAALHGLLRKVRDLGIPLISVTSVQTDQIDGPVFNSQSRPVP